MSDSLPQDDVASDGLVQDNSKAEVARLREQLISREKLAFIGQLSAGILHEIKNPLNFVNTFSTLTVELLNELEEGFNQLPPSDAKENFTSLHEALKLNNTKVLENGKRAERIILTMLTQSRDNKTSEFVLTDINQMVDEFSKLAYQGMRGQDKDFNLSFKTNFDVAVGKVKVDQQDLSRVILNIVSNACYALNERRRQSAGAFSPQLTLTTSKQNNRLLITIKDNGTGMPQSVINKVFNPFFTTKPNSEGTGLGLYLSYDIVTNIHKGELRVQSQEGEFTEFSIDIPVG